MALDCTENNLNIKNILVGKSSTQTIKLLSAIAVEFSIHVDSANLPELPNVFQYITVSSDISSTSTGLQGAFSLSVNTPFLVDLDIGWFQAQVVSLYDDPSCGAMTEVVGIRASKFRIGSTPHQQDMSVTFIDNDSDLLAIAEDFCNVNNAGTITAYSIGGIQFGKNAKNSVKAFSWIVLPISLIQVSYFTRYIIQDLLNIGWINKNETWSTNFYSPRLYRLY